MEVEQTKVAYGKHRRQYSLVIRNRDPAKRRPDRFAFYFHGGAWTFGKPETFTPAAIPWLDMGFTVIFPSYRRPPIVGLNRIVADCRAAVHQFAKEAGPNPVIHLGGISAGGHLAAVLATEPGRWLKAGWGSAPSKALICGGPLSLGLLKSSRLFLPRYDGLDAIQQLSPPDPAHPIEWQLIHGTIDPVVALQHSEDFLKRLQELGYKAGLRRIEGGRHLDSGRWMFGEVANDTVCEFLSLSANRG